MSRLRSWTKRSANFKAKIQDTKGGQMSRPRYKTWKGVIVKANIQNKDGGCWRRSTSVSKSRCKTRRSANIKAKIHDKEECQCWGWDPGQVEGLQMQLKVKIHFVINSPCELCYPIWCWTWPKSHSPGQCIVPGLSQGVQGTLTCTRSLVTQLKMYQVWVKESKALFICTRSLFAVQDAPGLSKRVQGTLYIYLDTLHTAQDVQGLNKQPRAQFKLHQVTS